MRKRAADAVQVMANSTSQAVSDSFHADPPACQQLQCASTGALQLLSCSDQQSHPLHTHPQLLRAAIIIDNLQP